MKPKKPQSKNPEEITIYSGELTDYQKYTAKIILKFRHKLILSILSPRQVGKSYFIQMMALASVINVKEYRVVILSPTFANCRKQFKFFRKMFNKMPGGLVTSMNATAMEIELWNGSSIGLKSAEMHDALRGDTCNTLYIDEAAFLDTDEIMSLCFPYTNATHGNIILCSTPKWEDPNNLFYKFFDLGKRQVKGNIISVDWTKFDLSKFLSPETKELYRQTMAYNVFANEILGQFLTTESDLWDFGSVIQNGIQPTDNMVAGIDFASSGTDETVLTIFNKHKQMYRLFRIPGYQMKSTQVIERLAELLAEFDVRKCVLEMNSMGTPMADFLKKRCMEIKCKTQFVEFWTSNDSKRDIIETLALHIQNKLITLLDDNTLKLQFAQFEQKKTKSGLITYGNKSDAVHDDCVISTALALYGFKKGGYAVR